MKDRLNNIIFSNGFNYKKDGLSVYMKLRNAIAKAIIEKNYLKIINYHRREFWL